MSPYYAPSSEVCPFKILVTGGAGFIGSHLVRYLMTMGHEILVLDNLSTGEAGNIEDCVATGKVKLYQGDVRNYQIVDDCVKDVDSVVHLAALKSVSRSIEKPAEVFDVNARGTLNLLKASTKNPVGKFLFASSCAVYGNVKRLPAREEGSLQPLSPYGESKKIGEEYCQKFSEESGLETSCLRLFNVYGTGQGNSSESNVTAQFAARALRHEPLIIYGDGRQTRDFIHVQDVVEAIAGALISSHQLKVCNLGSGTATTVNEVANILIQLVGGRHPRPIYRQQRPGEIRHIQADTTRLRQTLGLHPSVFLEEGLRILLKAEAADATMSGIEAGRLGRAT